MNKNNNVQDATLAQLVIKANQWVNQSLINILEIDEYTNLNNSHLLLLAQLNGAETYSSELAKRVGVSRQAVYRTLRELRSMGIVELHDVPGKGKRKLISFTPRGRKLIKKAVDALHEIEYHLGEQIGEDAVAQLRKVLDQQWGDAFRPRLNVQ